MSEQIITKRCSKCKEFKPFNNFYKQKSHKDGYTSWCKICKNKVVKKYRNSEHGNTVRTKYEQSEQFKTAIAKAYERYNHSEKGLRRRRRASKNYRLKYPEREKAYHAVNNAIKLKKLQSACNFICHYCDNIANHWHHWHGYAPKHYFDIFPVCRKCHILLHKETLISNQTVQNVI